MLDTSKLAKDVGTVLDGREAVAEGLINEVGGIDKAMERLNKMIEKHHSDFDKDEKIV